MKTRNSKTSNQLMKFIMEKWISKPIYAVSKLGIADILKNGPKTIEDIASMSNTHCPTLYRIMRALASVGIFTEVEYKKFALAPMAEMLQTGKSGSVYSLMFHSDWNDKAWTKLIECIRTGKTAFDIAQGMPLFKWLEKKPKAAELLHEANNIKTRNSHAIINDFYNFSSVEKIIDIGGGKGSLLLEILKKNPHINGIIAELPSVIPETDKEIKRNGLQNRCRTKSCDFFKNIPSGGDVYILSNILHDWPNKKCQIILKKCYEAMTDDSKLLIIEMIVPEGNKPSISKLLDLEMLVITGGAERTKKEFIQLFDLSGFKISRMIPMKGEVSIIELTKL